MTEGKPSPSGPRLGGDRYQHLYTWLYGAQLLLQDPRVTRIEFEVSGAGNVDDLVIFYRGRAPLYHQIKFVTSQQEPLDADWFTRIPSGARRSPLQRFHDSFTRLSGANGAHPEMVLLTNRWPEPGDALRQCTAGYTNKLMPLIAQGGAQSVGGQLRRAWSEHLDVPEAQLLEMLEHLALKVGQESTEELYERASHAMVAAGLRGDREAILVGMDIIKSCIEEGTRSLTAETLRPRLAQYDLTAARASATLLIQAIDHDPWPDAATASVDWVELFDGDDPRTRRQLRDPKDWNERLKPEVRQAVKAIKEHGLTDVNVVGAMRLSTALFVGSQLSRVANFSIRRLERGQEWSSESPIEEDGLIDRREIDVGSGNDVAVAVSVSLDISADVEAYIKDAALPVDRLIVYAPADGVGQNSVRDPGHGVSLADSIASQLRADGRGHAMVHFFIAGPMPLALLIGHRWNRIPTTQLYDDLFPNPGYAPTFTIDS